MYAAKAAAGGGPPGQVQGQQGVSSSGQGMVCVGYRNIRTDCSSSTWSPVTPWMSRDLGAQLPFLEISSNH